tara:strand:+ start:328 stop:522 length:195 start_codon:yes stop_codon:yes gene_type:complete
MAGIYPAITPETRLYRCVYIREGERIETLAGSYERAQRVMKIYLSEGLVAWTEEVPALDDDIPF